MFGNLGKNAVDCAKTLFLGKKLVLKLASLDHMPNVLAQKKSFVIFQDRNVIAMALTELFVILSVINIFGKLVLVVP